MLSTFINLTNAHTNKKKSNIIYIHIIKLVVKKAAIKSRITHFTNNDGLRFSGICLQLFKSILNMRRFFFKKNTAVYFDYAFKKDALNNFDSCPCHKIAHGSRNLGYF